MAEKENNGFLVDDMRDYALITLMKTFRRLELLDEKRNNESDIAKISRYIGLFVQKALQDTTNTEVTNNIFDKFPEILEIYDQKDEHTANEMTKELMKKWRKALLNSVPEYKKLSENDCETVILNAEKVYDEVFKPYIENHNKSRRNKNNQIDRKEFVKAVMNGEVNEDVERIVLSAKENVIKKLQDRKKNAIKQPLFKEEINSIVQGLDISYSISRNSNAVKQANRKVRSYFSKADAATYRKEYPEDYTVKAAKEGSKEDFLRLLGSLAITGYNQIELGIQLSEDSFNNFKKIMQKNYPENTEEVISKSLGVAQNADKETQVKAFADKSASVYTQMLGGFMQLRMDVLKEAPNANIIRSFKKYIDGMQNGVQDIQALSMLMPDKDNGEGSVKEKLSRDQHVNVDHKIPIASAIPLLLKLHPELGGNLDPNKLQLSQLLAFADDAAKLVDNIGNHRQVISKSLNDMLEANGQLVLDKEKDNSILAVRYSLPKIQEAIKKMFASDNKKLQRYREAFTKYTKANERGVITTNLALSETAEITRARKENTSNKNILDVRVITENILSFEK